MMHLGMPPRQGLYDPAAERACCGTGFVADIGGHRSHAILDLAVRSVVNLTHRGALDADGKSGDGAGLLTQLPYRLLRRELARVGVRLDRDRDLGVGMFFLPRRDAEARRLTRAIVEGSLIRHGFRLLGWRPVPVDLAALGAKARATVPEIEQILVGRPLATTDDEFERLLYLARKEIERQVAGEGIADFFIPSFSHRTVVYKGLFVAPQLGRFYADLADPDYETALAVFHQRYSTNTFPTWFLAQPFRMLAHNGEINTLQGNRNWMHAREAELRSPAWGDRVEQLKPVIVPGGSDSASLDNALELLVLSGRDIRHAFMMLIPEAWETMPHLDPDRRAFYEYHACLEAPWDGPAAIAFTDGWIVGATLDRNGLRPARYKVTEDGLVVMASEVGVVDLDDGRVVEKGRLGPGQMIAVDTLRGALYRNDEIKDHFARRRPYRAWVERQMVRLRDRVPPGAPAATLTNGPGLLRQQVAFGFTAEDLDLILRPMSAERKEPVGSMGDDTPLAVLSRRPRHLATYFKQKFAQVTNPPIDPLREQLVMSLNAYLGMRGSLLEEAEGLAHLVQLDSPVLLDHELAALRSLPEPEFGAVTLSALFDAADGPAGMAEALERLTDAASQAVDRGKAILVLSDRGVDERRAPIPMLLAVGAVVHRLLRAGKGMRADVVCETGETWDIHHFALLIGYGAAAINPYLALRAVAAQAAAAGAAAVDQALAGYKAQVDKGLLKIMSKMGISTLNSYQGAQIFEAIGLSQEVTDRFFRGTASPIGGVDLAGLAVDVLARHREAFGAEPVEELPNPGFYAFRRSGETHAFNPPMVKALQAAARTGNYADYQRYSALVHAREPVAFRDLLRLKPLGPPVPLDEVEPAADIVRRFSTQAMSIGALGPEAHRTLAVGMNRVGARSNTGEGGEDPNWWKPFLDGDTANSKIKQVASARFGVTTEYLVRAEQLEIKMAQGSKPGEGGQLPGHKVAPHIARIRRAVPGIPLISPPPHHDIYSIEDLSQLIYDLKRVNRQAKVGVKLVAEAGVGTVAAGVAKAYADVILISGLDGGTGASPLSSIKNAGSPWELGLSEAQQTLVLNDLRGRVTLRVDGGMKTGRDVIVAAMLGAEEFGFGSAAVVSIGCVMTRQCHLNTCPVGIATQREDLRAKFRGTPEMVIRFFFHVAEEVREFLASLGARSLGEIIGRPDLLEQVPLPGHPKANSLDLRPILTPADPTGARPRFCIQARNDRADDPLDDRILPDVRAAIERGQPVDRAYPIRNVDRAVGATIAGEIARRYGDAGLPDGTVTLRFTGSAGQSFGAFAIRGMRLILAGEANDYVGKGLGGGDLVLAPPPGARFESHRNIIMGNTVLYGATGGRLFAAGRAGERFAVRNSGVTAVVEGVGDHGCEYMTAGCVVVLGETGRNFGAGMTNGLAYVYDEADDFPRKVNPELVGLVRVTDPEDAARLRALVAEHRAWTNSRRAAELLDDWEAALSRCWKVVPHPPKAEAPPRVRPEPRGEVSALAAR